MINDIRLASNELYSVIKQTGSGQNKKPYEKFEIDLNIKPNENKEKTLNKINNISFGAPAGFFADISLLNEDDAKEIGIINNPK